MLRAEGVSLFLQQRSGLLLPWSGDSGGLSHSGQNAGDELSLERENEPGGEGG